MSKSGPRIGTYFLNRALRPGPRSSKHTAGISGSRRVGRTDLEQVDFAEESSADGDERLLRPLVEPVDAGRVGDGRELAAAHAQCAADWREAQNHLHQSDGAHLHDSLTD